MSRTHPSTSFLRHVEQLHNWSVPGQLPPSLLNLFDRIPSRIHTGRKSTLECIHFLVVFGFGLIGLMLHLCTCRLRRLLLGLFVRRTLLSSATHGTDGSAYGCAPACVTGNRSERCPSQCSFGCSACSSSLRFWCVRSSLLFRSLHLSRRWTRWRRSFWINTGLLLDCGVTVVFISELLVVALVVLGICEHSDLLRRRKWWRRGSRGNWLSGRLRICGRNRRCSGTDGIRFLARCAQQEQQ